MQTIVYLIALLTIILLYSQVIGLRKQIADWRDRALRYGQTIEDQLNVTNHYRTVICRLWNQLPPVLKADPNLDFAHPNRIAQDSTHIMGHIADYGDDIRIFRSPPIKEKNTL